MTVLARSKIAWLRKIDIARSLAQCHDQGVRIALVIASLAVAAPAANACPAPVEAPCGAATCWHAPVAVAFVADPGEAGLVASIDDAGFGGSEWPEHSIGVLVTGSSVRYVGPLAGMTSDPLRTPGVGTRDDAVDLAIAELERTDLRQRALYVLGPVDMATFSRYREQARRSGIDTYVWPAAAPSLAPRSLDFARPERQRPPAAPHEPSRWPAVALLLAAAALSRRITG
jgi:hypothetical protein